MRIEQDKAARAALKGEGIYLRCCVESLAPAPWFRIDRVEEREKDQYAKRVSSLLLLHLTAYILGPKSDISRSTMPTNDDGREKREGGRRRDGKRGASEQTSIGVFGSSILRLPMGGRMGGARVVKSVT